MASPLYGTRDAGAYLGVSKARVLQLIHDGRLRAVRTSSGWQITREDLDRARTAVRPYRSRDAHDERADT